METLGDLVARDRRSRDPALRARTGVTPRYDYYQLCTTAQKTGNFLSHFGVGPGTRVGIVPEPGGAPILTLFGTALVGATARFDPPRETDVRVLVAPGGVVGEYDRPPGRRTIAYGEDVADPEIEAFGAGVWSENPACPSPPTLSPDDPVLKTDDGSYAHADLLDAAQTVAEDASLSADDEVAIRAPLAHAGTVVAGVLAPLFVGGTVVFPGEDEVVDVGVVSGGGGPEARTVDVHDIIG